MATTIRARIYARGEVIFAKLVCQTFGGQIFFFCQNYMDAKLVCQTFGGQIFFFCQNYMDAKLVYQTVGVALNAHKNEYSSK
jgi:hypothetical protein